MRWTVIAPAILAALMIFNSRAAAAWHRAADAALVGGPQVDGVATLADLRGVGVDIVTIGQYLRPTSNHLPVARWADPDEFLRWKRQGESLGIGHVEASPLTRSSYHAKRAADAVQPVAHGDLSFA